MLLLESLGITHGKIAYNLPIQKKDRQAIKKLLANLNFSENRPLVAIHPVAKWQTKLWSTEKFAALADQVIVRYHANLVFTGSRHDKPLIDDIRSHMKKNSANLAGATSLKTLAALYETADAVVSTDTGPMHLAAAVGTPVVALFGPTAPWRTGPFGSYHQIIRVDLECSPCFKRHCSNVECMERISVESVLQGLEKVLIDHQE
jgi:lipopolysaccharide heptosyltransferase II